MFQLRVDLGRSFVGPGNILNTSDGGYIACGTLQYNGVKSSYLVKIASHGQEEWRKIFESSSFSTTGNFVVQTADNGFLMIGEIYFSNTNSDILLIRTDSLGNTLWTKSYGKSLMDYGNNIVQLPSGNFLLCGESERPAKSGVIIRIDSAGAILEENFFSINFANSTVRAKLTGQNEITITGTGIIELYTDTSGIYYGQSNIELADSSNTVDMIATTNGQHIAVANMYKGSSTGHQLKILSIDSSGSSNPNWLINYGNSVSGLFSKSLMLSAQGGAVVAGQIYQAFGFPGWLFLMEWDSNGNLIWSKVYEPSIFGFIIGGGNSTLDGGYILTGSGYNGINNYDLFIIKTDSFGDVPCF